jgi:hypothetical protein
LAWTELTEGEEPCLAICGTAVPPPQFNKSC